LQLHHIKLYLYFFLSPQSKPRQKQSTLIDDATNQTCGESTSTLHVATAGCDGHQASTAEQGSIKKICMLAARKSLKTGNLVQYQAVS